MTTIAMKREGNRITMVADSAASSGARTIRTTKLWKLQDGSVVGGAGHLLRLRRVVEWMNLDDPSAPVPTFNGCELLRVFPDGTCWEYDRNSKPIPFHDDAHAVGSGGEYAIGAMLAGASVERAVEIAAERDPYTRGPFAKMTLEVPRGESPR